MATQALAHQCVEVTARRAELATFLRSRRERLHPEDVGLASGFRRRTPGLRREEVASLAGVGITWYTWLEQGRAINPSAQVVDAVARALRLDSHERGHLAALCGLDRSEQSPPLDQVSGPVQAILAALDPTPAYITNARYDILAWNRAVAVLYGDFGQVPAQDRNILWLLFTERSWRALFVDYEAVARRVVAQFRGAMGGHVDEAAWGSLVRRLSSASAEFRELWARYEIAGPEARTKRLQHPDLGPIQVDYTLLRVAELPGSRLLVYTPADDASATAMRRLADLLQPPG
jgi:transcriptional regulator with XRE-family HTH domain